MALLTKSKYMAGQQCLRLLWHSAKNLLPEKTITEKQKLSQGHEFEEYAYKLFPDAVNLADIELKFVDLKRPFNAPENARKLNI